MKRSIIPGIAVLLILLAIPALGQHHTSNWIHRTATDTTVVRCWTDSLTWVALPPNSMNMMMMLDSMYMRIDLMKMDSLHILHDSTFIGWCRIQAGSDTMVFNMMNTDSISGTHNMMQFNMSMVCQFRWDSLMSDAKHRSWHPTGMKGWNGSSWVTMPGVSLSGNIGTFTSSQLYSAIAFVGASTTTTGIVDRQAAPREFSLYQNYPNPFNPSTTIKFAITRLEFVTLEVYSILGQRVASLVSESLPAGVFEIVWDAGNLPSGVYLYRLKAGDFVQANRLVFAK
jgi:hypothetical protein